MMYNDLTFESLFSSDETVPGQLTALVSAAQARLASLEQQA
jgi:hypothetical protein